MRILVFLAMLLLITTQTKADCYGPYFVCKSPANNAKYNAQLAKTLGKILKEKR